MLRGRKEGKRQPDSTNVFARQPRQGEEFRASQVSLSLWTSFQGESFLLCLKHEMPLALCVYNCQMEFFVRSMIKDLISSQFIQ